MSADAQPNPKQRANVSHPPEPPNTGCNKIAVGALCVVCGDRACSHLYYGVAACHGCKCFFWRTVKSGLTYTCRFDGRCSISTAVRMDKKNEKVLKRKRNDVDSDEFDENQENIETPANKRQRTDHRLLTSSLMLIDRTARDGNGKMAPMPSMISLLMVIEEPEILDGDRTEMSYRTFALADETACAESERRLLTWAIDWTRQVAEMEDAISNSDKIALLRACCVPLTLLELATRSSVGAGAAAQPLDAAGSVMRHVLSLPNNTYLLPDMQLPSNCFLTPSTVRELLKWTERHLKPLQMSPKELVLLKALIVLNIDARGLSNAGELSVGALRDRVHSALFQHYANTCEPSKAATRLAKTLLLLPQLHLISMDVVEHQRMRHTFALPHQLNALSVQLFGDIFEDGRTDETCFISALCTTICATSVAKALLQRTEPILVCSRQSRSQQHWPGRIPSNCRLRAFYALN